MDTFLKLLPGIVVITAVGFLINGLMGKGHERELNKKEFITVIFFIVKVILGLFAFFAFSEFLSLYQPSNV